MKDCYSQQVRSVNLAKCLFSVPAIHIWLQLGFAQEVQNEALVQSNIRRREFYDFFDRTRF